MASPTAMAYTLTGEQLDELLELMADADSVELKLTVPERTITPCRGAWDGPAGRPNPGRARVVLRARRGQGKSGDCAVKLRGPDPDDVVQERAQVLRLHRRARRDAGGLRLLRNLEERRREHGREARCCRHAAAQRSLPREAAGGPVPARASGLAFDKLSVLGPILVLKLKFDPE
jgi:hypothetical protein